MAHTEISRSKTQTRNESHTLLHIVVTYLVHICLKLLLNSVINESYIILKLNFLHIMGVMLAALLCFFLNYFKQQILTVCISLHI